MKIKILPLIGLLLLNCSFLHSINEIKTRPPLKGSIHIYSSSELYQLTSTWANEFCRLNPNVKIELSQEDVSLKKNLFFSSDEYYVDPSTDPLWKMELGRDILVPIINSENPLLDEINKKGLSAQSIAQIFTNKEGEFWNALLNGDFNAPIHYYLINDEAVQSRIASFLGLSQNVVLNGIQLENEKDLLSAIQKDPYAIGFCKMADIIDLPGQRIVDHIKLLPIDRNGNGQLDYTEQIYDDLNTLTRGVWIGKYPKNLYRNIYSISAKKPTNEIEVAFLKWILSDGQQLLAAAGYWDLMVSERLANIELIYNDMNLATLNENYVLTNTKNLIITVAVSFGLILIMLVVFQLIKYKKVTVVETKSILSAVFNLNSLTIPKGLLYDKTHTWVYMEKDGKVKIGIDDFLQHVTGAITRVKMKNTGDKVKKGEHILSIIQNGKQLNIYAPISGVIKAQNDLLLKNSSIINEDPYSDGWVYRIEPTNWIREMQFLIMAEKYKVWLSKEFSRLRDFLTETLNPDSRDYALVVLQDGGELKDSILEKMGPEIWEDFQTFFIDNSQIMEN
ncbi:MAG: hypothetical protein ISR55_03830 [Bacteroidetes bacterium]|nr:hypothetical protein [Bacteroidota bacterium]